MALNLGELVAIISADDSRFRRTLSRVRGGLVSVGKIGALSALAGTATQLAVALAPAAGIAAALPAVWIANKVGAAALQLALDGLSDTLGAAVTGDAKQFKEALEELPPAGRTVARELGGALFGLKATAQANFFKPMAAESKGLGKTLREPVQRGIATITASMGRFGAKVLGVAREGRSLAFLKSLSLAIARGIDGAGRGVRPLVRGIRDFAAAGLGIFGRAGKGAGNLMANLGRWLSRMARGGQATRWIDNAVTRLQQLGRIGRNIALTLGGIFSQANTGAGDFLGTAERLTARMAEWARSAEGQDKIGSTFALINQTASDLADILPILVGPLGAIVKLIALLPGPTQGTASQMLAWAIVISVLTSRLGPLVGGLGRVVGASGRVVGALRNSESGTRRFASRLGNAASAAGRWSANMGRAAGRVAASFGRAALSAGASAGRMAGSAAVAAARVVGGWTAMAGRAVVSAAIMAAQWLIAFWPVALVVAAAGVAVFLIIKYWDQIVAFFTKTLPRWIKQGAAFVGNLIKNLARFGFLGPIPLIISRWGQITGFFTKTLPNAVSGGVKRVVNFTTSLPGRIVRGVGNLGRLLYNAGRDVLVGMWNGLVSMSSWLYSKIMGLVRAIIPGPVRKVLGIASPSRLFATYGRNLAEGLAIGMTGNTSLVARAAGTLADAATRGTAIPGAALGGGVRIPATRGRSTRGGGMLGWVRVVIDLTGADADLRKRIQKIVRVDGRGSVQVAFAGSR